MERRAHTAFRVLLLRLCPYRNFLSNLHCGRFEKITYNSLSHRSQRCLQIDLRRGAALGGCCCSPREFRFSTSTLPFLSSCIFSLMCGLFLVSCLLAACELCHSSCHSVARKKRKRPSSLLTVPSDGWWFPEDPEWTSLLTPVLHFHPRNFCTI